MAAIPVTLVRLTAGGPTPLEDGSSPDQDHYPGDYSDCWFYRFGGQVLPVEPSTVEDAPVGSYYPIAYTWEFAQGAQTWRLPDMSIRIVGGLVF